MTFERLYIDEALSVHRDGLHYEALTLLKCTRSGQDTLVLNGADQDAPASRWSMAGQAKKSEVIGFRGPGGEDDLIGVRANQRGDGRRRPLDRFRRAPTYGVIAGMRIAERIAPIGRHLFQHARIDGRRSLIVGVNRVPPVRRSDALSGIDWNHDSHHRLQRRLPIRYMGIVLPSTWTKRPVGD